MFTTRTAVLRGNLPTLQRTNAARQPSFICSCTPEFLHEIRESNHSSAATTLAEEISGRNLL